jgi:ABC-type branched-subunit amino acid transport system substrate-binding protein
MGVIKMNTGFRRSLLVLGVALALVAGACGDDDDGGEEGEGTTSTTEQTAEPAGCPEEASTGSESAAEGEAEPGGSTPREDGKVKFGTLVPQSGDLQVIVESLQCPINMAIAEINEAGGLLGGQVEVVQGDDGTNANVAQTSYDKLLNTDLVDVILGPAPSGVAANMASTFATDRIPVCSGSTTSAELSGAGGGFFFRTAPGDDLQGPALANLIQTDGHTNVAIIARNDDYGKGFSETLASALEEGGSTVTETVLYDPESGSGYDADVQKALDSSPDAVAIIGFNDDGAQIVNAMIGKGASPEEMPTYTADGMKSSGFAATVDESDPSKVAGIKGTAPATAPAGIEHPFLAAFSATGIDSIFSSYFYDCTILMALAIEAAGSEDGSAIAQAFAQNLQGDNDCQTFAECKELLEQGQTIHYRGASNNFDAWNEMEPGNGVYDVWEYTEEGADAAVEGAEQITIEGDTA